MVEGKVLVAICQYGGEFMPNPDGSLSYSGGEAHAIDIDFNTPFDEFKAEMASLFNIDISNMSIKYFLPSNRRTLITISSDKEFKRMVDFNVSAVTADIFILSKTDSRSIITDSGISAAGSAADFCGGKRKRVPSNGRASKGRVHMTGFGIPDATNSTTSDIMNGIVPLNHAVPVKIDHRDFASGLVFPGGSVSAIADGLEHNSLITTEVVDPTGALGIPIPTLNDVGPHNSIIPLDDAIKGVGQEFDNVKEFRALLCEYAIAKGFAYRFVKNESSRVTVKCVVEGCPWRIHASEISRKQRVVIKKMNGIHTCKEGQRRATRQWLTSVIKEKLHALPHCKPKEIVKELYEEYGVPVTYSQVWRGREVAKSEIFNTVMETYKELPKLCARILAANPNSFAFSIASQDTKFRRFFLSFYASLYGFKHGCRSLLFLDRIPLKSNNQCKLLTAVSVDGDDAVFPVAFAVVEDENYDSWHWFLEQLKCALNFSVPITFISGRQKGLDHVVLQVFENGFHSYCLHHLIEDFKAEISSRGSWTQQIKDAVIDDFTRAAQACTDEDFNACIESIRNVSPELADWVMLSKPENWSNASFKGSRYDHFSSSIITDTFSTWIPTKHESSILKMVDAIHRKLMEVMKARPEASKSWGTLTPSMELKLQKELAKARKLNVLPSSRNVFEVRGNTIYVVDISRGDCTCQRWRLSGLPCMHAAAVFNHIGRSIYDICPIWSLTKYYSTAYAAPLKPAADIGGEEFDVGFDLGFPGNRRTPGRPRRKRVNPNKTSSVLRLCSRCKVAGHNKATCEALL